MTKSCGMHLVYNICIRTKLVYHYYIYRVRVFYMCSEVLVTTRFLNHLNRGRGTHMDFRNRRYLGPKSGKYYYVFLNTNIYEKLKKVTVSKINKEGSQLKI